MPLFSFKTFTKGQSISKAKCQAKDSSKNEQMNSFLLLCDVFLFVFLEEIEDSEKTFEIT